MTFFEKTYSCHDINISKSYAKKMSKCYDTNFEIILEKKFCLNIFMLWHKYFEKIDIYF